MSSHDGSKKARRDAAREHARARREQEQKRRRRNRWFLQGGIGLAVIAVAAIVVVVVANSVHPAGPGPKNMASDGVLLKGTDSSITAVRTKAIKAGGTPTPTKQASGVANITIYEDYLCPFCNQFETTNISQIKEWVKNGSATLEIHPFALLDRSSAGSNYSSRATNAAACVANYQPDKFLAVNSAFYAKQPSEGTKGLSDSEIVSLVKSAGVTNSAVPSCITSGKFRPWVAAATERTLNDKIPNSSVDKLTGTPLVIVNGKQYPSSTGSALTSASEFAAFVQSATQ
ncbi:DsbA family protein [Curtobacterium sp. RRHDQ10]|uniref:DsbA family protein n=1 Tax=Curtobacterium phyllosphaerae TaxID=3413379 RepID=UPI003BF42399